MKGAREGFTLFLMLILDQAMSEESGKLLWKPTQEQIMNSNLQRFMETLSDTHSVRFSNYNELHKWSIDDPENFWSAVWTHTGIKSSVNFTRVLVEGDKFPGARWFSGARLNYAENLLRTSEEKVAVIGRLENGTRTTITYQQFYHYKSTHHKRLIVSA